MTDYGWLAIEHSEVVWLLTAFALGFAARSIGLPPLVGYLGAGFLLGATGATETVLLQKLADLGVTLLLFTVGLKLSLKTLGRPQVWAVAAGHMALSVALLTALVLALTVAGLATFADINATSAVLVAFAMSFSSTVYVVKVLEDRGEVSSLYGRIAIGILLIQDVAAVAFLAFSTGAVPSLWALGLLLLWPLARVLDWVLHRLGHGELLVLFGFLLALGGAELFELCGLKGDLGALVLGVLLASRSKADELAKAMLGFKDLFLLGFFLSIGLAGPVRLEAVGIAAGLTIVAVAKGLLFFFALVAFRVRARTALLTAMNLATFSEFGLIVIAMSVDLQLLAPHWLMVFALSLAFSFALAALAGAFLEPFHRRFRDRLRRVQRGQLIPEDQEIDLGSAVVAILGMGGIGSGAYDRLERCSSLPLIGVDIDPITVAKHQAAGRRVLRGDPSDLDFWDRVQANHALEQVLIALPKRATTLAVLDRLKESGCEAQVFATARFADDAQALSAAGASSVYNTYTEAGAGFARHALAAQQALADSKADA